MRLRRPSGSPFGRFFLNAGVLVLITLATGCGNRRPVTSGQPTLSSAVSSPVAKVDPFTDWSEAVIYFVIVDRFADGDRANNFDVDRRAKGAFHGGDLDGLREQLDEISGLGVTAIWITPVVKNIAGYVSGAGFPDWAYHGYWADDFESIDRRFGTEEDLRELVQACRERGIRLLLDVVYNHTGYDSSYLDNPRTRAWFRTEDQGTCGQDDVTSCVAGLPDLRTELPEVADYLFDAHLSLASRVGLDGFRLDTVKHVSHEFWREHRRRTRERLGDAFFLVGEVWGGDPRVLDPWFERDEMDAGFDFSFQGSVVAFLQGRGRSVAFNRYLEQRHGVRDGYRLAHFLSSHDVPGALHLLEGDVQGFLLAAVLQFTTLGIPVVYYGEEVGRYGGDWPDNRSDMPWGNRDVLPGAGVPRDETLRQQYRRLIGLRRAHPSLWRGAHAGLVAGEDLLVFARRDEPSADVVVVAVNRGTEATSARFDAPEEWAGRPLRDLWGDLPVARAGGSVEVSVPGRRAAIVGLADERRSSPPGVRQNPPSS